MDVQRRAREAGRRRVVADELARARRLDHDAASAGLDHLALVWTQQEARTVGHRCPFKSGFAIGRDLGPRAAGWETPIGCASHNLRLCRPAYSSPMDVEMRHLRALLAVAEELNFTRAAERLHLTQQALSGQIRQLEQRVGTRLVERDSRRVALTPAGEELSRQARPLLAGAQHAVASARAAGGEQTNLTVGYIAPVTRRMTAPAIRRFEELRPDVALTIHFANFLDSSGGLREGSADVAILYGEFDREGIELHPLFSEPRGVALPSDHPLAAQGDPLELAQIIEEPIVYAPAPDRTWVDFWTAARHRRTPARVGATVTSLDGIIEAVAAGLGIAVTLAPAVEALGSSAVVFRSVNGLEPLDFWVACRQPDERPAVRDFVQAAIAALGER
jgi:DNA-binding transcriptional LysR family regulator